MGQDSGGHCWSLLVGQRQWLWYREGIPMVWPVVTPGAVIQGDGLGVRCLHGFAHVESRVEFLALLYFCFPECPARSLLAVTFLRCCFLLCKIRMIVFNYFIASL